MKTTTEFKEQYGIKPDTYKKYKAAAEQKLGKPIGTKQGNYYYLTAQEEMVLLAEIPPHLLKPQGNHQGSIKEALQNPIVTITESSVNATHIIPTPAGAFDISTAIGKLDGVKGLAYEKPAQMRQAVEMICGAVLEGIQAKAADMEQNLQETKKEQYETEAIVDSFNRQTAFLRQKMKATASEQTDSTQALSEAFNAVMQLGKQQDG